MSLKSVNIENLLTHQGRQFDGNGRLVNLPIQQGSTMLFDTLASFEKARNERYVPNTLYYGRYGNESSFALETMMADLEGAEHCISVSSGLTAVSMALMALTEAGSHLLVADTVYGPTRSFCDTVLTRFGVEVSYFDPMMGGQLERAFRENTSAIMLEAPGTGTFEVPDLRGLVAIAKKHNIATILDGTWATPVFCQPMSLGIDIIVHSGSKYLSGHADVMIGFIVCRHNHYEDLRKMCLAIGDKPGAQDVFLTLRGLRTLNLRMRHHEESGLKLAHWFSRQPSVERVLHPALHACPGHEFWKRDFTGASGLFSVLFKPVSEAQRHRFVDGLSLFGLGVSWGGFESLALPVDPSSSRTAKPWIETGFLVRFSVGLESVDELIADLTQAIEHLE